MKKLRVIPAPRQDDSRVVVLGAILDSDRVVFHAVFEPTPVEIEAELNGDFDLDSPWTWFDLADDFDTRYTLGSAMNSASAFGPGRERQRGVWHWEIYFEPAVPEGATKLTVSHIDGSIDIAL